MPPQEAQLGKPIGKRANTIHKGGSSLAAIAGYSNTTVPMGFVGELPVNISFFGRAYSEPILLTIAYAFEQGAMHRKSPKFLK